MQTRLEPKQKANAHKFIEPDIRKAHEMGELLVKEHIEIASVLLVREKTNYAVIILDDLTKTMTSETVNDLKLKITETLYKTKNELGFHLILASDIWRHYKEKSEQIQEMLRNSYVVKDNGFINPLQELFVTGKIRPTKESVVIRMFNAEKNLKGADKHINSAMIDIYWAVVDTAHATVMASGQTPPSPEHLTDILFDLATQGKIHKRCPKIMKDTFKIAKDIIRKRKWTVTGKEFDKYLEDAKFFQKEMTDYITKNKKR